MNKEQKTFLKVIKARRRRKGRLLAIKTIPKKKIIKSKGVNKFKPIKKAGLFKRLLGKK